MSVRLLALALALSYPAPSRALGLDLAGGGTEIREASPEPAGADTTSRGPSLEPHGVATVERAAPEPAVVTSTEGGNWLDVGHAFIEHRIFAPAVRVDRFFSDERDLEAERARSFIQWRQDIRFTQFARVPHYTTGLTASLKLPGLNLQLQRLSLEVSAVVSAEVVRSPGAMRAVKASRVCPETSRLSRCSCRLSPGSFRLAVSPVV